MANRVAAIVVPKEVHQKISQTYGGRNTPDQIAKDDPKFEKCFRPEF